MITKIEFNAMGSRIFTAVDQPDGNASFAEEELREKFEVWENTFSRFKPDSELNRINHSDGKPVPVSQDFWNVLLYAQEAERISQGLVTPMVETALVAAGYTEDFGSLNGLAWNSIPEQVNKIGRFADLQIDPTTHTIFILEGCQLDLGGIVKGWAAHQAAQHLKIHGPVLVDAGGDIAISGPRLGDEAWLIGVADPLASQQNLELLQIKSGGVATSGTDYRRWMKNGVWQHHIIDPYTGMPAITDILTATVIAPTVMIAEVHSKTAIILGSLDGSTWLVAQKDVEGMLVLKDGRILYSRGMEQYLWRQK
jgi:thiamine biosynthesis lipoprotein